MDRRQFLKISALGAGTVLAGDLLRPVLANPLTEGETRFGPLGDPDPITGLRLPDGFSGRVIARSGQPVLGAPGFVMPVFPDGSHCFPNTETGGWYLVVNSENPPAADFPLAPEIQDLMGGASVIEFDASGQIVDARVALSGTRTNCAGGATPWGTWLSCEEFDLTEHVGRIPNDDLAGAFAKPSDAGRVWEVDPYGRFETREVPTLGRFKHEAAAFDDEGRIYLTEDMDDGVLYRFTPASGAGTRASLDAGRLDAAAVASDGSVTWVGPIDPSASTTSTRFQAEDLGATTFDGGEGCAFQPHGDGGGTIYVTTKNDDKVWALDTATATDTIEVIYPNPSTGSGRVLRGVDNIIWSNESGNLYVAEDGDDMELVVIENGVAGALVQATGPQHGVNSSSPVPTASEIVGLALSPDRTRMYFSSQRGYGLGITYEITAPEGTLL